MTAWVEVRPAVLTANAAIVCELLGPNCRLAAVVKGNGYGHGAVLAARALVAGGAALLAVSSVAEAVELRAAGLDGEILLLASHAPDEAETIVEHNLIATVSNAEAGARLAAAARRQGVVARAHLLIDCGMGRDGAPAAEAAEVHRRLLATAGLSLEGVFTHFPTSIARDKEPTRRQLATFLAVVAQMSPRPALCHAANSGAAVDVPASRLDLARVGTLLYGQRPSRWVSPVAGLAEAFSLKARLVEVRRLPAGATIGYGSECRLKSSRLVGTLAIGWQHGFTLAPASLGRGWRGLRALLKPAPATVTIGGVECPVLGRVAMQSCAVDVTAVPQVAVGEVATVPARRVTTDRGLPRVAVD
jgi:alanine racemase